MKVLHVIPTLGSGGAEKMLIDIVKEMLNQNISCEVVILTKSQNFFGQELERLNIPVYYGSTKKVYTLKNIVLLKKVLRKNSYDFIHTHLFGPQLFTPIALKLSNKEIPLITTEHSTHNKRRDSKLFYWLDNWMYKQYNGIIAITSDTKAKLIDYLPSLENKIKVIENGIDSKKYKIASPVERKSISNDLTNNEKIVLMVAAMREQKDHETLVRASKFLPPEYRVIFVGDGERMEEVKKYATLHGDKSILFLGSRKDVPSLMKASDVFVLSSKWEGFGLVVVEAAASGLPVVASNVEGLNDVVQNIGGLLFEPFNENDLVEKILIAAEYKEVTFDVTKYTIQATVRNYIDMYKESLKG